MNDRAMRTRSRDHRPREAGPWLSMPYPTAEQIRKHLLKCEAYVIRESGYAWVKAGKEMKMANIFPDETGKPGEYPTSIDEVVPTDAEMADPTKKEIAMHRFKQSSDNKQRQELYIVSEKAIIMSMLKDSLTETTKDILRQNATGRTLLLSKNEPLEFINLLTSTDFSREGIFSVNPLERYHKALAGFSDKDFRQQMNESLHDWHKRFNSEVVKIETLATEAGVEGELAGAKTRALQFFDKLNSNFNELRRRYETGLQKVKPDTVAKVVEEAKYFDKPSTKSAHITQRQPPSVPTQNRGVYHVDTQNLTGNKQGRKSNMNNHQPSTKKPRLKCLKHNTNDHKYGSEECMRNVSVAFEKMKFDDQGSKSRQSNTGLGGKGTAKQS